ncbi:hypothetical protein BV898_15374 [Hypsibius exemplaris]|uniref:Uncharacterized protein n=1 Tax=Hypsibius exemplaris TaxID=2072580 RepID=A0A9X6RKN3_HYPEX|nr:hypothetical protein BV898_15374 [Hypsibius exemplaris]
MAVIIAIFSSFCLPAVWATPLTVEIVTLGLVTPAWPGSIHFTGTGFDEGFRILREKYEGILSLTHTFLVERKVTNCVDLVAEADVMLSEWYYKRRSQADLHVYLSPSKYDS